MVAEAPKFKAELYHGSIGPRRWSLSSWPELPCPLSTTAAYFESIQPLELVEMARSRPPWNEVG